LSSAPSGIGAPTLAPTENPPTPAFTQRPLASSGPIISSTPPATSNGAAIETRQKPIELQKKPEEKSPLGDPNGGKSGAKQPPESKPEGDADSASSTPKLINPGDRTTMRADRAVRFAVHRAPAAPASGPDWLRDTRARPVRVETQPAAPRGPASEQAADDDADGWRASDR
jgi:hypothetical protein